MEWKDYKVQKMKMPLKWITFNKIFWTGTRMCYYILSISVAVPFFWHFFRVSISSTPSLSISVTLGLSIHFIDTSSMG